MMGFPKGEKYTGSAEQQAKLERQFLRKAEFMYKFETPIWNGEALTISLLIKAGKSRSTDRKKKTLQANSDRCTPTRSWTRTTRR